MTFSFVRVDTNGRPDVLMPGRKFNAHFAIRQRRTDANHLLHPRLQRPRNNILNRRPPRLIPQLGSRVRPVNRPPRLMNMTMRINKFDHLYKHNRYSGHRVGRGAGLLALRML